MHCLQSFLAKIAGLNSFSLLHQIFVYSIIAIPQLRHFGNINWSKLRSEALYVATIWARQLRLPKLQNNNVKAEKIQSKDLLEGWKDVEGVLHHQGLLYIPKIISSEMTSGYQNDLSADHFGINKTRELIVRKYF